MSVKVSRRSIFHYALIYVLLLFQGSPYFKENGAIYLAVGCALAVYTCIVSRLSVKKTPLYRLKGPYGTFMLIMMACLLVNSISNRGSLSIRSIGNVFATLLLAYSVLTYDLDMFVHRYIKVVYFLSCISLIGFIIQMVCPDLLLDAFPEIGYGNLHGFLFFMYSSSIHPNRNIGMFTEPGLFAMVLCIAIFLLIFRSEKLYVSKSPQRRYLFVLIITLITVKSTTGYMVLMVILASGLVSGKKYSKMKNTLKWGLFFIFIFVSIDLLRGAESLIQTFFISKIFNEQGMLDLSSSTGGVRIISAFADLQVMVRYPLGAGFDIYEEMWPMFLKTRIWDTASCAGLTKSLATYGIPCVISFLAMLCFFLNRLYISLTAKVCAIVIFVIMTMSQPTIFYPAFICMFMAPSATLQIAAEP